MPTELDSLTGLANRRGFFEHLQHELGRALRQRRPLAVALYDLDRFKLFNDRAGHPAGDDALRRIGWLLRDLARDGDVVGRIGGDNFGAVFPGTTFEDALWISDLAQRRAAALPAYAELRLCLSYGVAELRLDDTAEEVLRRAELDLGPPRAAPPPAVDGSAVAASRPGRTGRVGSRSRDLTPPALARDGRLWTNCSRTVTDGGGEPT